MSTATANAATSPGAIPVPDATPAPKGTASPSVWKQGRAYILPGVLAAACVLVTKLATRSWSTAKGIGAALAGALGGALCVHFNQGSASVVDKVLQYFEGLGGNGQSATRASRRKQPELEPTVAKAKVTWERVEKLPIPERRRQLDAMALEPDVAKLIFERETAAFRTHAGIGEQPHVFDVPTIEKARVFYSTRGYRLFLTAQAGHFREKNCAQGDHNARLQCILQARDSGMHPDLSDELLAQHWQLRKNAVVDAEAKYNDQQLGELVQDEANDFWKVFADIRPLSVRKAAMDEFVPHLHADVAELVGRLERESMPPESAFDGDELSVAGAKSGRTLRAAEHWDTRCAGHTYPELRRLVDESPDDIREEVMRFEAQAYLARPGMGSAEALRTAVAKDRNRRMLPYSVFTGLMDHARSLPPPAAAPA